MSEKAISILAVRLIGLYCIVLAISPLPGTLSLLPSNLNDPAGLAVVIAAIISTIWSLLIGMGLWYWSVRLGGIIAGDLLGSPAGREFPLEAVQTIAVSLVGLFVLTSAVPDLFSLIISWLFPKSNPRYMLTFGLRGQVEAEIPIADFLKVGIELAMGFWLLLGSRGVVAVVKAVWKKGMPS
jgi:hypothetical protein